MEDQDHRVCPAGMVYREKQDHLEILERLVYKDQEVTLGQLDQLGLLGLQALTVCRASLGHQA